MNKGYTDNEILVKTVATLDSYVKSLWGDPFNVSKCMKATLGQAKRYWREGKGYTLSTSLTPDDVMEMAEMLERLEPQIKESVVKLWEKIQAAEIEKKKRETIKAMKQITFRELLKVEMEKWGVKYSPIWQGYRVKVGLRLNNNYIMSFICLVLPDSPFEMLNNSPIGVYLGYFNYFRCYSRTKKRNCNY